MPRSGDDAGPRVYPGSHTAPEFDPRRISASSCLSRVLYGERPGQDAFILARLAGQVRRRPFVPDVLTGILVYFQGSPGLPACPRSEV